MTIQPGRLIRDARLRHGLSQKRLAKRAGTTQSAISRIEQERISPTVQTLAELLHLMGEELVLKADRWDAGVDLTLNRANLKLTPEQRVRKGLEFADFVRANRGGESSPPKP
jgi:transcriptional regulator with XRE-family HTH domain